MNEADFLFDTLLSEFVELMAGLRSTFDEPGNQNGRPDEHLSCPHLPPSKARATRDVYMLTKSTAEIGPDDPEHTEDTEHEVSTVKISRPTPLTSAFVCALDRSGAERSLRRIARLFGWFQFDWVRATLDLWILFWHGCSSLVGSSTTTSDIRNLIKQAGLALDAESQIERAPTTTIA